MRTVLVIMLILASGVFVACGNSGNSWAGPDAASPNARGSSSSACDSAEIHGGQASNPKQWIAAQARKPVEGEDSQVNRRDDKGDVSANLLER